MAKLTEQIPPRMFEQIRDRIGQVLSDEFGNQHEIDASHPNISQVWIERVRPFTSETELPTINISLARGDFSGNTVVDAKGTYAFNVDIYTIAQESEETGPADQYAMVLMERIMGMCWAILSNNQYRTLLFDSGIYQVYVKSILVADKRIAEDALSSVVGRIVFMVEANESKELQTGTLLLTSLTHVTLESGPKGFYYEYNREDS